jgi:site-specific DNA-methyltransferase (adenine-specific)
MIVHGDCAEVMRQWVNAGEHVELAVTSPPYDNLRTYGGFAWDFPATAHALYDILCDGGILCWNVGDATVNGGETLTSFKQALYLVEKAGFTLHDTMIYEKPGFSMPSSNRYHQIFEYVFVLSKGKPRAFNPIKDKPNIRAGLPGAYGKNTKRQADGSMKLGRERPVVADYGMRHNIWRGPTASGEYPCKKLPHPAMMPQWLARDLILSFSNEGDTVLDPFGGSGTTGLAAQETKRQFRLIDVSPEYVALMEQRLYGDIFK